MTSGAGISEAGTRRASAATWTLFALAVLMSFSVLIFNRGPLYYFDSAGYYKQGAAAIELLMPRPAVQGGDGAASSRTPGEGDDTVVGSRSMVYALLVAGLWDMKALIGVPVLSFGVLLLMIWLVARTVAQIFPQAPHPLVIVSVPLLAAAAGSMPFYVAYVMPDLFAPVLLLAIAALTVLARDMSPWSLVLTIAIGTLAVTVHPSHLVIAGLAVPVVAVVALLWSRDRWWWAPLLVLVLAMLGAAERKAFKFSAETVADKEVFYVPHMTARLIVDGPGLAYLKENCPDPGIATCKLFDALSWSDDPYRMTVSHILFETSPRLGSFRRMPPEDQKSVAASQIDFFRDVLRERPVQVLVAFARNTLAQVVTFSIDQTVPRDEVMTAVREQTAMPDLRAGPLAADRGWIGPATALHTGIYLVSFAGIAVMMVWPGAVPARIRAFVAVLLLGILINAFVCGAVSQPADRYGARVIWLLPFGAALMALWFRADRRGLPADRIS